MLNNIIYTDSTLYDTLYGTYMNDICSFIILYNHIMFFETIAFLFTILFVFIVTYYTQTDDYMSIPPLDILKFSVIEYNTCIDRRLNVWRLITYSIVHSNFHHFISNYLYFVVNFIYLKNYLTFGELFMISITSCISGAIFYTLHSLYTVIVGSSGITFGLYISSFLIYLYNVHLYTNNKIVLFYTTCINIVNINSILMTTFTLEHVAHFVHFGGMINALLLTPIIIYKKHMKIRITFSILYVIYIYFMIYRYTYMIPYMDEFEDCISKYSYRHM